MQRTCRAPCPSSRRRGPHAAAAGRSASSIRSRKPPARIPKGRSSRGCRGARPLPCPRARGDAVGAGPVAADFGAVCGAVPVSPGIILPETAPGCRRGQRPDSGSRRRGGPIGRRCRCRCCGQGRRSRGKGDALSARCPGAWGRARCRRPRTRSYRTLSSTAVSRATVPSTSFSLSRPNSPRRKVRKSEPSPTCSGTPAALCIPCAAKARPDWISGSSV